MHNLNELELALACSEEMHKDDKFAKHCAMEPVSTAPNEAYVTMVVEESMLNGHGTCHGGVIFSLADTAFAHACNNKNRASVAMDCRIDFLLPAYCEDRLIAKAEVKHEGKRSSLYEVSVFNQKDVRVAVFQGRSYYISRPVLAEE